MAKQINVDVTAKVDVTGIGIEKTISNSKETATTPPESNKRNPYTAQWAAGNLIKVANSIGGDTELVQAVSKASSLGFQAYGAAKAISLGLGYAGAISLAINLASQAITEVRRSSQEKAAQANAVDSARIRAGLMDVSDVKVTQNWFSKRNQYSERN